MTTRIIAVTPLEPLSQGEIERLEGLPIAEMGKALNEHVQLAIRLSTLGEPSLETAAAIARELHDLANRYLGRWRLMIFEGHQYLDAARAGGVDVSAPAYTDVLEGVQGWEVELARREAVLGSVLEKLDALTKELEGE